MRLKFVRFPVSTPPSLWAVFLFSGLLLLTGFVYSLGLPGSFLFDDYPNLLQEPLIAIKDLGTSSLYDAIFSGGERFPGRGLARLSYALNYYFAGEAFEIEVFKLTNILIHLANGVLIYLLSLLLVRRWSLAGTAAMPANGSLAIYFPLLVAGLWLLHPIQLTSVLYVVQRMTSMAAFFVFAGLAVFVWGRGRFEAGHGWGLPLMLLGVAGGTILGALCKENAVLLPYLALLLECFFFSRAVLSSTRQRWLLAFYALTVALPTVLIVGVLLLKPDFLSEMYLIRDFTLYERLLTETRILFFYLGLIFIPDIRAFGLFHDDINISRGVLEPLATLWSVGAWALLLGLSVAGIRRQAMWAFGILWFVVGHGVESGILGLEIVHEHRNYVPTFGLLFAALYYLATWLERVSKSGRLLIPVLILMLGTLAFVTSSRANVWQNRQAMIEISLRNHPQSSRLHGVYAITNHHRGGEISVSFMHYQKAAYLDPASVITLIEMRKLLSLLQQSLPISASTSPNITNEKPPLSIFSTELSGDAEQLRLFSLGVDEEIESRLRSHGIQTSTLHALRNLQQCISKNGGPYCVALSGQAKDWFYLAIANQRLGRRGKAILLGGLAELYLVEHQPEQAIALFREAADVDPSQMQYVLELVSLYLKEDRLREADKMLRHIELDGGFSALRQSEVDTLKQRLAKALSTSS